MANEPAKTAMQVPAHLQKFMQTSQQDASSLATASISVPRLSFRGKKFRWKKDGEEEIVKGDVVDVIILGVEPGPGRSIKTYYKDKYEPGSTDPPTCSSSNGVTPDAWVQNPQAKNCANCPMNAFGSATSQKGRPSKACKDGKRLWVARPGMDPNEYYGMTVPVMSLKNISDYGKYIQRNNFPLSMVITELSFDDDSEFPQLTFSHKGFVSEEHADAVAEVSAQRPWIVDFGDGPLMLDGGDAQASLPQPGAGTAAPQQPAAPTGGKTIEDVVAEW